MEKTLYYTDYNLWIKQQVAVLKEKDLDKIDWVNLIDEISSLARTVEYEIYTLLSYVCDHLLLLKYNAKMTEKERINYKSEIFDMRFQIMNFLEDSPSLINYIEENYLDCYVQAIKAAQVHCEVPDHVPFPWQKVLIEDFFGD